MHFSDVPVGHHKGENNCTRIFEQSRLTIRGDPLREESHAPQPEISGRERIRPLLDVLPEVALCRHRVLPGCDARGAVLPPRDRYRRHLFSLFLAGNLARKLELPTVQSIVLSLCILTEPIRSALFLLPVSEMGHYGRRRHCAAAQVSARLENGTGQDERKEEMTGRLDLFRVEDK